MAVRGATELACPLVGTGWGRQGRGVPMPPWPPCGPLLPTRRLKRGPRGLEQKPVPKNVGVGGPGPCGWSTAHRARIQEAMLREAGGPQDPQWRAAASEEEGSGPPGPRRPLQQDCECSGLGGCREGPAGPSCPGCHTALPPRARQLHGREPSEQRRERRPGTLRCPCAARVAAVMPDKGAQTRHSGSGVCATRPGRGAGTQPCRDTPPGALK